MFSGIYYPINKTWFFLIFTALMSVSGLSQKINTLSVEAPVELAGDYMLAQAEWGDTTGLSFQAQAVTTIPAEACTPIENDVNGKVAFIRRGTCSFGYKALEAQKAGAIAVVICNSTNETLFLMAPDSLASQITIPVFLTSTETCQKLEIALSDSALHGLFQHTCKKPSYPSNIVWGDKPGQGDFKNGFDGWTTDRGWTYNAEGVIRKGAYTGAPRVVGSATACDGVAEFNSDHLDNDSSPGGLTGSCHAPCTGFLLSPIIQLDKPLENGLVIEFSQTLRQFQSQYFIIASKDGGLTWTDTIKCNTELQVNSSHISERKRIALVGFEGISTLRFKFEIIGNYYYWALDDIVIVDEQSTQLKIDRFWYSVAPIYKMPSSQASEIPFMADIQNEGNKTATDVMVQVRVTGPATQDSFSILLEDIQANSTKENMPFPLIYTSPARIGTYKAEYHVSGMEESDGPDNRAGFQWKVTEKTFGNLDTDDEFGSTYMQFYAGPWLAVPLSREHSIGNIYYVPNGHGMIVSKARFGIENPISEVLGQSIRVDLFEWEDRDDSNTSTPDERKRIGSNILLLDENIVNPRLIETDIWLSDADGHPIELTRVKLKDNTTYLVTATVLPNRPEIDPLIKLLGYTPRGLDDYNRSIGHMLATNFTLDSLQRVGILGPRSAGSLFAWENPLIPIGDVSERHFRFIFNGPLYTKAFLEMDVEHVVKTDEIELNPTAISIFPNPAARDLFVDIYLTDISQQVDIYMYDVEGKLVSVRNLNNIKEDRVKLDVSTLTNGVYNVRVVTAEGIATRKVVIQN